jgi:hypothetical protein
VKFVPSTATGPALQHAGNMPGPRAETYVQQGAVRSHVLRALEGTHGVPNMLQGNCI